MLRTITFICVNYHSSQLVASLVQSIQEQGDAATRCMIVDNTPGDLGLTTLSGIASITLLDAKRNRGFGGGCNLALAELESIDPQGIAWLINPDARLLPDAIATVRRCLQDPAAPAVLGTRICDDDGQIWFDHGRFDRHLGRLNHEPQAAVPEHQDVPQPSSDIQPCDWVSGCSMILDLARLPQQPRFDEQMFLYYEDAELCLRLRRQGARSFVTQNALVSHTISAIASRQPIRKYKYATFGKLYLLKRHATIYALVFNLLRFYARSCLQLFCAPQEAIGRAAGATQFILWSTNRKRPLYRL